MYVPVFWMSVMSQKLRGTKYIGDHKVSHVGRRNQSLPVHMTEPHVQYKICGALPLLLFLSLSTV